MLKITPIERDDRTVLELEGKLAGPWVDEMRDCWRQAGAAGSPISVVLKQVTFIDGAGKTLLREMCQGGADIEGAGCMVSMTVEEIKRGSKS